jgi:hypothetical protein
VFDTFISYNTKDEDFVTQLVARLRQQYQVNVWIADEQLPPGLPWSEIVTTALATTKSVVVCIGPHGYGRWQELEIDSAVSRQVESGGYRVVPVLLPGVDQIPTKLLGVDRNTYVQFTTADDATALFRLCWGITGVKPRRPDEVPTVPASEGSQPPETSTVAMVEQAVSDLAVILTTGNAKSLTYFVGPAVCWPPSTHSLVRQLLAGVIDPETADQPQDKAANQERPDAWEWLPPIDLAASYYTTWADGNDPLLLKRLFGLFNSGKDVVPEPLALLASLLERIARRPMPRTAVARPLIVTTNFDLMIERALLQAGVSFTRVVQHRDQPRIDVNHYPVERSRGPDGKLDGRIIFKEWEDLVDSHGRRRRVVARRHAVDARSFEALDERIFEHNHEVVTFPVGTRTDLASNPLSALSVKQPLLPEDVEEQTPGQPRPRQRPWPLVYKHHGSEDIEGSYAVSAEQHLQFMRDTMQKGNVPTEILNQIKDSPILFLGYSFLDPALRLIYNTLLHDRIRQQNRLFSVQEPPQTKEAKKERRIESLLWRKLTRTALLQMGVETVEQGEKDFLQTLLDRVDADLRGMGH